MLSNRRAQSLLILACAFLSACTEEVLVDSAQLPSSEKGAVALGRYFVAGGSALLEVVRQKSGAVTLVRIHEESDCVFTGMTARRHQLYAACTRIVRVPGAGGSSSALPVSSKLVRVDLKKPEGDARRVKEAPLNGPTLFPNGMAWDAKGRLYIANTYSFLAGALGQPTSPAVLRVQVTNEEAFTITQSEALPASQGFASPNGVQISGDTLYLTSMNRLFRAKLGAAGLEGLTLVYEADRSSAFDDFALLPGGGVLLTEVTNPFPAWLNLVFPGTALPEVPVSRLALLELAGSKPRVIHEHSFTNGLRPSSVSLVEEGRHQTPALYVTDYFQGGVYRLGLSDRE